MASLSLRCRASAWRRAASFRSRRCATFPSGVAHAFAAIASATTARCRARSSACFARSSAASSSRIPGEHDRARPSGLPPKARSGDDAELRGGAGEPRSGELRGGCGDERGDGERSHFCGDRDGGDRGGGDRGVAVVSPGDAPCRVEGGALWRNGEPRVGDEWAGAVAAEHQARAEAASAAPHCKVRTRASSPPRRPRWCRPGCRADALGRCRARSGGAPAPQAPTIA